MDVNAVDADGERLLMSPVRQMWNALRPERGRLALAAFLGFVAAASSVALLGTSGWLISYAAQMPPVLALSVAAVMVRTFALSRSVFRYLERLVGHDAALRGLTGLRVSVYERLEHLAPVGIARFSRGDLLARLVADVDAALDLPLRVILPWAQAGLVAIGTAVFLAWLVPSAGIALAVALAIGLVCIPWVVARISSHAEARLAPTRGELSTSVVASLDANADLLAFGATDAAIASIGTRDVQLTAIARREAVGLGVGSGLGIAVQGLAVIACLSLAVPAVIDGRIGPAWLAVAALLPLAAYDVVMTLPASAVAYQRVRGSAQRVAAVLDAPLPVTDPTHPAAPPPPPTVIACRDLSASWSAGAPPTLHGIDFHLGVGERVAVVGPSGAGKSTFAAVLVKFLAYEGTVLLGDREVSDLDGDAVRERIGLLSQQAHIFDTTVRDNLRLGRRDADEGSMLTALERVHLSPWLAALPRGLDTELGPLGASMSGGERQRLALARLLLADRAIVVLDEPTEHLDRQTADDLTDDLLAVTTDSATVLITHRLHGLDRLDRIVVLMEGRVVAEGTHAELLAAGGWYADQWLSEVGRFDLSALAATIPPGSALVRSP